MSERIEPVFSAEDEPADVPDRMPLTKPRATSMRDHLTWSRLVFSQKLVGWCIALLVLLLVFDSFRPLGELGRMVFEALKLTMMTALGFVLARASEGEGD